MADYEEIKKIEDKRIQMFVKLKRKNRVIVPAKLIT